ncbi:response regulator [Streptomyces sp. NPDC002589]|uniref:response regulator n=1 Tax=Streptomyces sp. NPDC002589 TaxID=3154420 RepID=UPI00331E0100
MIRILVVDDDFNVSHIHSEYVSRVEGFEVVGEAASVAEAVQAVRAHHPDLLLLDIFLPDGTGLDVLRQLIQDQGDARPDAFVITADHDISTVRAAMKLGAVGYLVKPFSSADLAERLNAYRELHHRMDTLGLVSGTVATDQADVDALFSAVRPPAIPRVPVKGHSAPTLTAIHQALRTAGSALSATEAAELTGVSRATAQRYLTYLEKEGIARLELRYGATGRPEHRYRIAR